MAWFWKKKKDDEQQDEFSDLPPLPPLPEEQGMPSTGPNYDDRQSLPPLPPLPELPPLPTDGRAQMQLMPPPLQSAQNTMPVMPYTAPVESATVFVRLDKYKEIMHMIGQMQAKLDDLQRSLAKISSIKQKETEIIQGWHALMSESKAKIDELNQKLLRPGET